MNREQYLAKRMWLRGIAPDAGNIERFSGVPDDDEASEPPTTSPLQSLPEYYRKIHGGDGGGQGTPH